jgi:hypothetical protein
VQSSSSSSHKQGPLWDDVRHLVAQGSAASESDRMRVWTCGVNALKKLSRIHSDLIEAAERFCLPSIGDKGICRFRALSLCAPAEVGKFEKSSDSISFGELYQVEEISAQRGWIKISSLAGGSGWIESHAHFGLSRGEYKILSSFKRNHRASFVVNVLSVIS